MFQLLCDMKQIALVTNYETSDFDFPGLDISTIFTQSCVPGSLEGTRWRILFDRSELTIDFGPGGSAICTDENGVGALVTWTETPDSHFVVQWDPGLCGARVCETLFGVHNGKDGSGIYYNSSAKLIGFSMIRH